MNKIQRKCLFEAQEYATANSILIGQCNSQAYYFDVCLYRELAEMCPKPSQMPVPECKRINDQLNPSDENSSSSEETDSDDSKSNESHKNDSNDSSSEKSIFSFLFS